jgi:hypothetical protein
MRGGQTSLKSIRIHGLHATGPCRPLLSVEAEQHPHPRLARDRALPAIAERRGLPELAPVVRAGDVVESVLPGLLVEPHVPSSPLAVARAVGQVGRVVRPVLHAVVEQVVGEALGQVAPALLRQRLQHVEPVLLDRVAPVSLDADGQHSAIRLARDQPGDTLGVVGHDDASLDSSAATHAAASVDRIQGLPPARTDHMPMLHGRA